MLSKELVFDANTNNNLYGVFCYEKLIETTDPNKKITYKVPLTATYRPGQDPDQTNADEYTVNVLLHTFGSSPTTK